MLYFAQWKVLLICGICLLGVLFSLPNVFTPAQLAWLPASIPHKQVNLGLDLRGGSYLLLEVDVAAAQTEQLNSIIDNVRDALLTEKGTLASAPICVPARIQPQAFPQKFRSC